MKITFTPSLLNGTIDAPPSKSMAHRYLIAAALAEGKRVELRGFGAFSIRQREARIGRNPKTGKTVSVEPKSVPFFKAGKRLKNRLTAKN